MKERIPERRAGEPQPPELKHVEDAPGVRHEEKKPEISTVEENLRKIERFEEEERQRQEKIKKPPPLQ